MKKLILVLLLLCVFLTAANPIKLARLTVINKSGEQLYIDAKGQEWGQFYWLTVEEGDRAYPLVKVYTIIPDIYKVKVFFGEDMQECRSGLVPVPYNEWKDTVNSYNWQGVSKFVVTECGYPPPNLGDPGVRMYKWQWFEYIIK